MYIQTLFSLPLIHISIPSFFPSLHFHFCPSKPNIRKRLEMNLFLQEGVCICPPFPRTVCNSSSRSKVVEGYYYEKHNFDSVDYALLNSPASLREEQQKRQARLQNCSHEWNAAEMKIILKSVTNMTDCGWSRRKRLLRT